MNYRQITMEHAQKLYLAMHGDEEAQKEITIGEIDDLEPAGTFERFLLWNKRHFEVIDLNYDVLLEGLR